MTTITADERESIRETFARLLAYSCDEAAVRRAAERTSGYDTALWTQIAEMGLPALLVPVDHGGVGGGALEIAAIMEAAGAALLPSPLLATSVLATGLIAASTDDAAKRRLLPGLADGSRIATVVLADGSAVEAAERGGGWALDGTAAHVLYGAEADILLVAAAGEVFEVDATALGVSGEPLTAFDRTQRLARISFTGVSAVPIAGGATALQAALNLGHVALAAEQAGAARKIFDITVEYIRTRVQFGRPIGGFQAIKHMAADLLVEVESCTSMARDAAAALAQGRADADATIAMAAFACSECFNRIAFDAIQMHGGIGFTSEHPAHLYFRRARATAHLLGSPDQHRERYISILEQAA